LTGNALTQLVNIASDLDQIKVLRDIIADDQRNVDLVSTITKSGELTRIDIETATSQFETDRTLLPPLNQDLSTAGDALALLVGKAPAEWQPPQIDLNDLTLPTELPVSVPSALVHERPDILMSEAQLHAAGAAIGVATAQLYPNITLTGSIGQAALTTASIFSPASAVWAIGGQLAAPIFEGGTLIAQKKVATDAYDLALANYEQTVLQSFSQVADVLHALQNDAAQVQAERRAVDTAGRSLGMMRTTFAYGSITLLQVLDAERQYAQARLGYVRASAQRFRDTIALFVAMGGGRINGKMQ
jgi:NodT family efflux transporter outer membrane factor (OMF) lipoprotein